MSGANIKIGANSSEFQKQMNEVTRQLRLVSSECGVASQKAKLFGTAQEQLGVKQKELTAKIKAQTQMMKIHQERILNINATIDKQKIKQSELSKKIEEVSKKHEESIKLTGRSSEETKKLGAELQKLKEDYAKNERAIESSKNELVNATTKMNNTEKALIQNQKALENINKEISNSKIDKLVENFDKVSEASGKLSDKLKPASTAITGIGTASVAASITFEDSMAKVSTIADETEVSYDSMKKSIIDLSNQTGISANDIADNVYNAISAGQSTGDAVNFVTNSTKLAKAGFAEAGQSLDVLTTIMNAYGLEADRVGMVSDTLVQVQNKGKTTVAELASTMGKIIPTANSMGVSLDQLGAGYALMTSKGIATAETTTYMNSLLNELGKSGTKASEALKKGTGKTFQQLTEGGYPLGDVLVMLEKEAKKSGVSLADMFGSAEAGKAALVLATDSGDAFNSLLQDMEESLGATDLAFEKVNNTTGNSLKKSLNEVKNSAIKMGDTLSPVTSMVAEGFSKITRMLSNLSSEQLKTIAGVGAGIVALNLVLAAVSKVTNSISSVVKGMESIKTAFNSLKKIGLAVKAFALANPATIIIAGIVALIATIVLLWNKCEWFRELCYSLFEGLKQAWDITLQFFKSCWDWFVGLWNSTIEVIKNVWQGLCNTIKSIWEGIVNTIKSLWNGFNSIFESVGNSIRTIWDGLTSIISSVWSGVVSGIKNAWNGILSPFETVVNSIIRIWNNIKSIFKLPHFSITGSFSLVPPSIPKVSVDWYYTGGIFKSPTLLGGIGVGDAFNGQGSNAEAVVPLDEMYKKIREIVRHESTNSDNSIIIIKNYMDSEEISNYTYKKVDNKFALAGRSRR